MTARSMRLVGWVLAINAVAAAALVALGTTPVVEGARAFAGWCGIG